MSWAGQWISLFALLIDKLGDAVFYAQVAALRGSFEHCLQSLELPQKLLLSPFFERNLDQPDMFKKLDGGLKCSCSAALVGGYGDVTFHCITPARMEGNVNKKGQLDMRRSRFAQYMGLPAQTA
eukprot:1138975-Pelagomonas_calceolata.AAC.4